MSPTSFDSAVLYATDHGSIEWVPKGHLQLQLGRLTWQLSPDDVAALHEVTQPLAGQVYRCNCDCRWQLRVKGEGAVVLESQEVLRLHSLLDGGMAMLELESILDDAAVTRAPQPDRR